MKLTTHWVFPDEPCFGMYEGPMNVPQLDGTVQERWLQDVTVIRNDRKAHYVTDFGPASDYEDITPMLMPSFGENTVAQIQAFAEKNRHDNYWAMRRKEMLEGSTLIEDHVRQFEQSQELINNRSTFGPVVSAQRNGYPREASRRRWFDERARRTGKRSYAVNG